MAHWHKALVSLLLLLYAAGAVADEDRGLRVAPSPAGEKRVALVIGNSAYKQSPLPNPVNDAKAMAESLKGLGFEVTELENGSLKDMQRAILAFGERLKSASAVGLFYYAGHGMQVKGQNYIIPVDAQLEHEADARVEAVPVDLVTEQMGDADDRINVIVLDACRDNPFERKLRGGAGHGLAAMDAARGTLIAYATSPGSVAADGSNGNGLYTEELLKAMKQPNMEIEEVFKRVRAAVVDRSRGIQTPWESSSLIGDFVFNAANAPVAAAPVTPVAAPPAVPLPGGEQMELAFWESIKASSNPADFEAYLAQYPKGAFVTLAHNRLVTLTPPRQIAAATPPPAPSRLMLTPPPPGQIFRDCPDCPEMIVIPPGQMTMGTDVAEAAQQGVPENFAKWERPRHQVTLKAAIAVGKFDVTRGQYARFAEATGRSPGNGCNLAKNGGFTLGKSWRDPGFRQTDRDPVVCVTWGDAKAYAAWLSRISGQPYRLLSEAEWEYAARGGTKTARWWGQELGTNRAVCGHCGSQWDGKGTAPGGSFPANPFGLSDMLGNAFQWVEDCWTDSYANAPGDAAISVVQGDCARHVVRGGGWGAKPHAIRVSNRYRAITEDRIAAVTFRVARGL